MNYIFYQRNEILMSYLTNETYDEAKQVNLIQAKRVFIEYSSSTH